MPSITAQLPEKFEAAAAHIEAVGLHQDELYDIDQHCGGIPLDKCSVCAFGALSFALCGSPTPFSMTAEQATAYNTAGNLAAAYLHQDLALYSAEPERTTEGVAATLRNIAASARSGDLPYDPREH